MADGVEYGKEDEQGHGEDGETEEVGPLAALKAAQARLAEATAK
jgi:hypothetical protein